MSSYDFGVVREVGMRRLGRMGMAKVTCETSNQPVDHPIAMQTLYEFKLQIKTEFWSSPATRDDASKEAYRHLMCLLHREELDALSQLRMAIYNGDKEECMTMISHIQSMLQGEER